MGQFQPHVPTDSERKSSQQEKLLFPLYPQLHTCEAKQQRKTNTSKQQSMSLSPRSCVVLKAGVELLRENRKGRRSGVATFRFRLPEIKRLNITKEDHDILLFNDELMGHLKRVHYKESPASISQFLWVERHNKSKTTSVWMVVTCF